MHALGKLIGWLVQPFNLLLVLFGVAAAAWLTGWRRVGLTLATVGALGAAVLALTPVASLALKALEQRFSRVEADARGLGGVIVLGGATGDGVTAQAYDTYLLGDAAERLTTAVGLRRRHPDLPILIAGFSHRVRMRGFSEGEMTRRLFADLGVDPAAFTFEERSRNTFENARFSAELLGDIEGRWLLVTSAFHMPRAVGVFRAAGFDVVAYPVDYRVPPSAGSSWPPNPTVELLRANIALKEWVGLVSYRLLGRTDALFPAPR